MPTTSYSDEIVEVLKELLESYDLPSSYFADATVSYGDGEAELIIEFPSGPRFIVTVREEE